VVSGVSGVSDFVMSEFYHGTFLLPDPFHSNTHRQYHFPPLVPKSDKVHYVISRNLRADSCPPAGKDSVKGHNVLVVYSGNREQSFDLRSTPNPVILREVAERRQWVPHWVEALLPRQVLH
jgi:hypothetical protein